MERVVKVKGKGFYCFKPNWLDIVITIEAVDTSYKKAMKYLCEKVGKLVDCINEMGLDSGKLETLNLTTNVINDYGLSIDYETYYKDGVKVSQKFRIGIEFNIDKIQKVVYELLHCGISAELLLIQTVKDIEKLKAECIVAAVKAAEEKAKAMVNAVGLMLGDVVSLQYEDSKLDNECECYVSQDYFDNEYFPITTGTLFGYHFFPYEVEMSSEVEVEWEIK